MDERDRIAMNKQIQDEETQEPTMKFAWYQRYVFKKVIKLIRKNFPAYVKKHNGINRFEWSDRLEKEL